MQMEFVFESRTPHQESCTVPAIVK